MNDQQGNVDGNDVRAGTTQQYSATRRTAPPISSEWAQLDCPIPNVRHFQNVETGEFAYAGTSGWLRKYQTGDSGSRLRAILSALTPWRAWPRDVYCWVPVNIAAEAVLTRLDTRRAAIVPTLTFRSIQCALNELQRPLEQDSDDP